MQHHSDHGAPVLDGALAWLVCELDSEFRRGDHVVAIGRVLAGDARDDAEPLLFYRGKYGLFGPQA